MTDLATVPQPGPYCGHPECHDTRTRVYVEGGVTGSSQTDWSKVRPPIRDLLRASGNHAGRTSLVCHPCPDVRGAGVTDLVPLRPDGDPLAQLLHTYLDGRRSPNTADTYRRDITH